MRAATAVLAALTAPLGCYSATTPEKTLFTIGLEGGQLQSPDGRLRVDFPPGAVDAPTRISVEVKRPAAGLHDPKLIDGRSYLLQAVSFDDPELVLLDPVRAALTVALDPGQQPAPGEEFLLAHTQNNQMTPNEQSIFTPPGVVVGSIERLTELGVIRQPSRCASESLACGEGCSTTALKACDRHGRCVPLNWSLGCEQQPDGGVFDRNPVLDATVPIGDADPQDALPVPDVPPIPDSGLPPSSAQEVEPNDTLGMALPLAPVETVGSVRVDGTFTSTADVDYYSLQIPRDTTGRLHASIQGDPFSLACNGLQTRLRLLTSGGAAIADDLGGCALISPTEHPAAGNLSGGEQYYLEVSSAGSVGFYSMTVFLDLVAPLGPDASVQIFDAGRFD
jgi:hypothetical protein